MANRFLIVILLAVSMISASAVYAQTPAIPTTGEIVPASPALAPTDAAKEALTDLLASGDPALKAELLSNRTAASMGGNGLEFGVLGPAFAAYALSQANNTKGEDDAKSLADLFNARASEEYKKFGSSIDSNDDLETLAAKANQGRAVFVDGASLLDDPEVKRLVAELSSELKTPGGQKPTQAEVPILPPPFSGNISDYHYFDISPSEVRITLAKSHFIAFRAVVEDGAWRIDLGDTKAIMQYSSVNASDPVIPIQDAGEFVHASAYPGETSTASMAKFSDWASGTNKDYIGGEVTSGRSPDAAGTLAFADGFQWNTDNTMIDVVTTSASDGREVQVWLGKRADYYHILGTDLVLKKVHNAKYPRMDTMSEAILRGDVDRVNQLLAQHPSYVNGSPDEDNPVGSAAFFNQPAILLTLLRHVANPNGTDSHDPPLVSSCYYEKFSIAEILLAAGADPSLKDSDGKTALDYAKAAGNHVMVKLLEEAIAARHSKH